MICAHCFLLMHVLTIHIFCVIGYTVFIETLNQRAMGYIDLISVVIVCITSLVV